MNRIEVDERMSYDEAVKLVEELQTRLSEHQYHTVIILQDNCGIGKGCITSTYAEETPTVLSQAASDILGTPPESKTEPKGGDA